jgi:lipoate-protein ligase A
MINQGILNGLASLGLQSAFYRGRDRRSRPQRSPLCFDAPSRYEVLIEGKKILGSAQVRKNGVLLQQGSLPLEVDKKLLTAAIKIPGSPESEPSAVHIPEGLNGFMAEPCRREEIVSRLIEGFRECFRNEFITDTLTHGEVKRAEELQCDKYASSAWTLRR